MVPNHYVVWGSHRHGSVGQVPMDEYAGLTCDSMNGVWEAHGWRVGVGKHF